ncbi:MAG: Mth938-like domain-containing protein [Betaproteobacteria bacterium]|nr:Mth938-like domain-containing protein [Betaproteobacteria bacterium]
MLPEARCPVPYKCKLKLHSAVPTGLNTFTGYGEGYVLVNGERYARSLVVLPRRIVTDWPATTFEALTEGHIGALLALECEIVLLGTGSVLRFPRPELLRPFSGTGVGIEVMDVHAACRTYNILMAEERKVAAALLIG